MIATRVEAIAASQRARVGEVSFGVTFFRASEDLSAGNVKLFSDMGLAVPLRLQSSTSRDQRSRLLDRGPIPNSYGSQLAIECGRALPIGDIVVLTETAMRTLTLTMSARVAPATTEMVKCAVVISEGIKSSAICGAG
jgi:hypothetical protein